LTRQVTFYNLTKGLRPARALELDFLLENFDRPIRYFVKIAELKSFSKAADHLDLTQSGLSRQLGSLETYLGQALFSRTGRGGGVDPRRQVIAGGR
jgi:hypothetical protein